MNNGLFAQHFALCPHFFNDKPDFFLRALFFSSVLCIGDLAFNVGLLIS